METVGKIGKYISKGVYIVSGPFHPFGGAVDIIIVEQPDGTFKSSPWYVRFGKFQGVLKTREKIVKLFVNGVEAELNMYLNHKGEAYFLAEAEEEDPEWKRRAGSSGSRYFKSKSCNYDSNRPHLKNVGRSCSTSSSRCLSCYGRRSFKDDSGEEEDSSSGVIRRDSYDHAEMAAELLEYKWSTNFYSRRKSRQLNAAGGGGGGSGSVDSSDVKGTKVGDGESQRVLCSRKSSSKDGQSRKDDISPNANGSTVGSIIVEEKGRTDENHTNIYSDGSDGSVKQTPGILSSPERIQVDNKCLSEGVCLGTNQGLISVVQSLYQTVNCDSSPDHALRDLNIVSSTMLQASQGSIHNGDRSSNDCILANGQSKSPSNMSVKFQLGDHEGSKHGVFGQVGDNAQVEALLLRGGRLPDENSPNTRISDQNLIDIPMPMSNVASQMVHGVKRVMSMPVVASHFNGMDKRGFHHSHSYSLDTAALSLPMSSLSENGTGSLYGNPQTNSASTSPGHGGQTHSTNSNNMNGSETAQPRLVRKMVRVLKPTSKQLASLNLKEGCNIVSFLFSTAMLGKQQVDARIYLWKWNSRVIVSDVDGTITKSDVLGQFMPLMGIDWSHVGVANLYSAIKENGYHMLFLSARAISQAYLTRQFLFNLKQNGKALPDGPVVISPDGLFPSFYREVIMRRPQDFKIACLEEIKSLFPSDCSPFYAGFGNRDTDEISYLKVGVPKGKIFIINPKGDVAVNRHVDTKSYTSLHSLVHGMFPPINSAEQEDYNSWNFWKLPPPPVDI